MKKYRRFILLAAILAVIGVFVAGCGEDKVASSNSAFCGYLVGNGEGKHDNNLHGDPLLPGDSELYRSDTELAKYVPCNPRNYYVVPPDVHGDRHTASLAKTTKGTDIKVWSRMYWRLNQNKPALKKFFEVCVKYSCFSDRPAGGTANFSTDGWNGMLEETFSPTVDQAAFAAISGYTDAEGVKHDGFDDEIWKHPTQSQYDRLATNMAQIWMQKVQSKTGFNTDLFCGSSSGWEGSGKNRQFQCKSVYFEIYSVEPVQAQLSKTNDQETQAEQEKQLNGKRLAAAEVLYGADAKRILGQLDLINACRASGDGVSAASTCIVNLGEGGTTVVSPSTGK